MYWYYLTVKILLWVVLQVKRRRIRAHVLVLSYCQDSTLGSTTGKRGGGSGPMYWYYLTGKILLWVVLQVKRRMIRAHVLVLSYWQDSTLGSTPGKEEDDHGPCTGIG
jgi:hypothetical protein